MNFHICHIDHSNKLLASRRQDSLICYWCKSKNLPKTFQCLKQQSITPMINFIRLSNGCHTLFNNVRTNYPI